MQIRKRQFVTTDHNLPYDIFEQEWYGSPNYASYFQKQYEISTYKIQLSAISQFQPAIMSNATFHPLSIAYPAHTSKQYLKIFGNTMFIEKNVLILSTL